MRAHQHLIEFPSRKFHDLMHALRAETMDGLRRELADGSLRRLSFEQFPFDASGDEICELLRAAVASPHELDELCYVDKIVDAREDVMAAIAALVAQESGPRELKLASMNMSPEPRDARSAVVDAIATSPCVVHLDIARNVHVAHADLQHIVSTNAHLQHLAVPKELIKERPRLLGLAAPTQPMIDRCSQAAVELFGALTQHASLKTLCIGHGTSDSMYDPHSHSAIHLLADLVRGSRCLERLKIGFAVSPSVPSLRSDPTRKGGDPIKSLIDAAASASRSRGFILDAPNGTFDGDVGEYAARLLLRNPDLFILGDKSGAFSAVCRAFLGSDSTSSGSCLINSALYARLSLAHRCFIIIEGIGLDTSLLPPNLLNIERRRAYENPYVVKLLVPYKMVGFLSQAQVICGIDSW